MLGLVSSRLLWKAMTSGLVVSKKICSRDIEDRYAVPLSPDHETSKFKVPVPSDDKSPWRRGQNKCMEA
jgi:hypothetical protein